MIFGEICLAISLWYFIDLVCSTLNEFSNDPYEMQYSESDIKTRHEEEDYSLLRFIFLNRKS